MIFEVVITFVGNEQWAGEDFSQFWIALKDVEDGGRLLAVLDRTEGCGSFLGGCFLREGCEGDR